MTTYHLQQKKEIDLNYLLQVCIDKERKEESGDILFNDQERDLEDDVDDVSTINSANNREFKNIFYEKKNVRYWIEIVKYILFGKQQYYDRNFIYPYEFRKNARLLKKLFYIFFFIFLFLFLSGSILKFLVLKYQIDKERSLMMQPLLKTLASNNISTFTQTFTVTPTIQPKNPLTEITIVPISLLPVLTPEINDNIIHLIPNLIPEAIPHPPVSVPKKMIIKPIKKKN